MFSSKEMDHLESEVDDIFGVVSLEKNFKYYDYSPLAKKHCDVEEEDISDEVWPLTIFLTPPSSPDSSPTYESILNEKSNENDEILSGASRTKDLKCMLIRDCMWNGESPKKGRIFEKLRPLTKTPPLIDCNLRMYVDPSEIWPFYFNDQLKAGKTATLDNNNDNTDEEVEVDVVGLEGNPKMDAVKKEGKEIKSEKSEKCDRAESRIVEEAESTPQCENTDHDYSCKLRSGVKRRRSSCSESDKENCSEQKTRVLSGDESDPECEILGRATHNVLERKRRNELKLRFQYLRDSIPDICGNDRAPKVSILQKAYSYILQLQAEERSLVQQIKTQKNRKDQLLRKVLEMQNRNLSF